MGKTLSKLRGHLITRPIQRFNIEHRTEKLLARDKPIQAPKFQSNIDLLEKVRRDNPEILQETRNRDPLLEDRLKQVFVNSRDPPSFDPDINRKIPENPTRPMPQKFTRTTKWKGFYTDPERTISRGKLSLESSQELLSLFKRDPSVYSIPILAEKYRIDPKSAENFVEYFRVFYMFHVKEDPSVRTRNDPYLPQPDWVDNDNPNKKVVPVTPAPLKPVTREELLRLGDNRDTQKKVTD